jgi:hypothetical protein
LELILALALSTLILAAVGAAIHLYLHTLDVRRTNVEEAQLARAVLRRMADDLRSAVWYEQVEFPSITGSTGGAASDSGDETNDESPDADSPTSSPSNSSGSSSDASSGSSGDGSTDFAATTDEEQLGQDIANSIVPPAVIGLYGNQYELQVDISRLPRLDQYDPLMTYDSFAASMDIPSAVKTVAYYLRYPTTVAASSTSNPATSIVQSNAAGGTGLVRREVDRAVAQWAADNGNLEALDLSGELLAPEVTYLEFRYFDGLQWLFEWDSELQGCLPMAVEIAIAIRSAENSDLRSADATTFAAVPVPDLFYRLVVRLPAAEPKSDSTAETEELAL